MKTFDDEEPPPPYPGLPSSGVNNEAPPYFQTKPSAPLLTSTTPASVVTTNQIVVVTQHAFPMCEHCQQTSYWVEEHDTCLRVAVIICCVLFFPIGLCYLCAWPSEPIRRCGNCRQKQSSLSNKNRWNRFIIVATIVGIISIVSFVLQFINATRRNRY